MDEKIMLSVICTTYNHERYLAQALDGIIIQETNFAYEVLIGEDCSTDGSRNILREYERKYPGIFTVFYREKNYGAKKNFSDLFEKAKGKYMCILETDDFWINPHKLQTQVNFLETHPEYIEVAHRSIVVGKNGEPLGLLYPECHGSIYTIKDYKKGLLPGQTTTRVFRNFYTYPSDINVHLITDPRFTIGPGDRRRAFSFVMQTKVACLPEVMSAYRLITSGGDSYNAKYKNTKNDNDRINSFKVIRDFTREYPISDEAIYVAEYVYFRELCVAFLRGRYSISKAEFEKLIRSLKSPVKVIINTLLYIVLIMIRKPFSGNDIYKKKNNSEDKILLDKFEKVRSKL